MQAAYGQAACALLTCTITGQVVRVNETLRRWVGIQEMPASLFDILTPASLLFFELQLRPLLAHGSDIDGAFLTLRHGDGSSVPVLLNAVCAPEGGLVEMAMLVVRERERYEAGLRRTANDAERALAMLSASAHAQKMQAVGQMAGGVAHEFNNLLAVVRGNLTFAQNDVRLALPSGSAHITADLEGALAATDRAIGIVRQLLAFTGRQVVRRSRVNLTEAVRDAAQLLVPALGRDVTWQTRLADDVWPVFAATDQLQHVITGLVLNARDAVKDSGAPGIVRVITENVSGEPEMVQMTVEDSGSGMTDEVRARAFDPFFTTKPVGQGVGLGLSMVYGTIEALGGQTTLSSTPGAGTRVTVRLPRAAA